MPTNEERHEVAHKLREMDMTKFADDSEEMVGCMKL